MPVYVLDDNNNKIEGLDKEGVLAVLAQTIQDGTLNDIVAEAAFVSKLKCCVGGDTYNFAFVTMAKYNELFTAGLLVGNTYYIITDDTTADDLDAFLEDLSNKINNINTRLDALGFKSGVASYAGFSTEPTTNTLNKQGKYCIFNFGEISYSNAGGVANLSITIPTGFLPKEDITFYANHTYTAITGGEYTTPLEMTLTTNGTITTTFASYTGTLKILNVGWQIA